MPRVASSLRRFLNWGIQAGEVVEFLAFVTPAKQKFHNQAQTLKQKQFIKKKNTYFTIFWLVPGELQTLHWLNSSVSLAFLAAPPDDNLEFANGVVAFCGVTGITGVTICGSCIGGGGLTGMGVVISVLVDVATNICGLDSDAISPSGRGIGLI